MATGSGLSRAEARWAMRQSRIVEMHGVLAYAEAFSIVAAGVTVTMGEPIVLLRRLIDQTIEGLRPWASQACTFPAHLRTATRSEIAEHMLLHARIRAREPAPWEARLAPVQIGDLRGVEQLAHWAAEMNSSARSGDERMLEAAITLTDFLRGRLMAIAGDPDDEDTARCTAPTTPAPDDEKPN